MNYIFKHMKNKYNSIGKKKQQFDLKMGKNSEYTVFQDTYRWPAGT